MNFTHWVLLTENMQPISAQQAVQILSAHRGVIRADDLRTDNFTNAERNGHTIYYNPAFQIANIGRRIQGYDMARVMQMINQMFSAIGLPPVQDPKQIDQNAVRPHAAQLSEMLPPIIVSIMPDESYSLSDGNHRLGCARVLGLPTLKAFEIQTF